MSWNGKPRNYTLDHRPNPGIMEVIQRPIDANDFPRYCDHCQEFKTPLLKIGNHHRGLFCLSCLELAVITLIDYGLTGHKDLLNIVEKKK